MFKVKKDEIIVYIVLCVMVLFIMGCFWAGFLAAKSIVSDFGEGFAIAKDYFVSVTGFPATGWWSRFIIFLQGGMSRIFHLNIPVWVVYCFIFIIPWSVARGLTEMIKHISGFHGGGNSCSAVALNEGRLT
jgi:hypothetical protein